MLKPVNARWIFTAVAVVAAVLAIWQSLSIPAPQFEPVGGARIPQIAAALTLLMAAIAFFQPGEKLDVEAEKTDPRGYLVLALFAALAIGLAWRLAGFGWIAAAFLVAVYWLYLTPEERGARTWMLFAAALIASAFGLEYLFTHVFVIDLPRSF